MEDFRWKTEEFRIDLASLYDRARDIASALPVELIRYFENEGQAPIVKDVILDWTGEWMAAVKNTPSLKEYVKYDLPTLCFFIITMKNDDNDASVIESRKVFYGRKRRERKRYSLEKCRKEKDNCWSDPDGVMRQDSDRYFSLYAVHPDEMKAYSSKEEYLSAQFENVRNWATDRNSELVEYPFFSSLPHDKKAWNFLVDLAYNCYAGYDSAPLTRQPESSIRSAMFSGRSQEAELNLSRSDISGYELYDRHTVDEDDVQIEMTTVVGTISEGELGFYDNNKLTVKSELLDSKDNEIFRHIFSAFSVEDVNSGSKTFTLSDIVKNCYPRPRKECYLDVIERLNKLCMYRMEYVAKDQNGKITEAGNLHFFDSRYHFPRDDSSEGSEKTVMTTNITSTTKAAFIEEIKGYDLKDVTIEVMPSATMQNSVRDKANVAIFTDQYMKLPSPKAKSMAMYLQMHRTKAYPKTFVMIPFLQVVQTLRLENMRPSVQLKEVTGMIDQILESQKQDKEGRLNLIDSYTCDREYLKVSFVPFTEEECRRYRVRLAISPASEQSV